MNDLISRKNLISAIRAGIIATSTKDVYSCGMRNGMRWCISLLDDKEPKYEDAHQHAQNDKPFSDMIHGMFDHIWDCQIEHPVFQDTVGDLMMAVIQCHKTLTEEKPEQRWIPVSERLPELGHRVLFKMWNNNVYIGILLKLNDGLKITLEPTGIGYVYSFENVIAWMLLPE